MLCARDRCGILGEAVEGAAPAAAMTVTLGNGLEFGLMERHPRLPVLLGECDRDERLVSATAVITVPCERVDEARRRHHFADRAALPKLAPAGILTQARAPRA